ncbi:MAG: hypothetical protein ACI4JM_09845 [Oscillospiraceae bacterium]
MLEFVLTNENQRKRIIKCAEPSVTDSFSYQNLNLVYGVEDKEKGFFLTLSYYLSDFIKRCDDYDDYRYVILTKPMSFEISCIQYHSKDIQIVSNIIPFIPKDDIFKAIKFYQDYKELDKFETSVKEQLYGKSLSKVMREYRNKWLEENK